jgi:hypothetical protein
MMFQETEIRERENDFYKNIIRLYLKYGSVDEVFRVTNYDLPISYPGMQHLIKRWGIIKSAGPNSKLSETLTFLTLLSDNQIPMERLFKKLPPSFKTSLSTMHRILHNVKTGVTRRFGTALVITPKNQKNSILMGEDITPPKIELGKPTGSKTLPMTYSSGSEDPKISILRVLQQEVYSELAVNKNIPVEIIPEDPKPFMHLSIADIKVSVYHLEISDNFLNSNDFSSFKVKDHSFISAKEVLLSREIVRIGVKEIITKYNEYIKDEDKIYEQISELNLALLGIVN